MEGAPMPQPGPHGGPPHGAMPMPPGMGAPGVIRTADIIKAQVTAAPAPPKPEGAGFPYPEGGFAYGKAIHDPYYYKKEDSFLAQLHTAELRAAYQLAYVYLYDSNEQVARFVDSLQQHEMVIVSQNDTSAASLAFRSNEIKHTHATPDTLKDIHLAAHKQILVFADADIEVQADQQTISQVTEFVNGGGTLLSFSSGVFLLDQIFPGRLKPRKGHTQSDKPIEIEITPSLSDASLFDKYAQETSKFKQLVRRQGMVRFDVLDGGVEVLLREAQPDAGRPLAAKFYYGAGEVFHSLTSHLTSKVGEQGGTSFQSLGEMSAMVSKDLATKTVEALKNLPGKKLHTAQVSWKAALNCGFYNSINLARSLVLSQDVMFELLRKYLRK